MRIGAVLSPVDDWQRVVEGARAADELGFDSVSFWDHYHSPRPEWGYVCGWAAYGYLAAVTRDVRFVPMVLNALHYQLGVLAKESSMLSIASGGRFELGIGAGDWPESFAAWGEPYPAAHTRLTRLAEKVHALRELWRGGSVTYSGDEIRLTDAICTPAPAAAPRVVAGIGASRRTLRSVIGFADELNVYADAALVEEAQRAIAESGRSIDLSVFLGWEYDRWPADPGADLRRWAERGIERCFVNVGATDIPARLRQLVDATPSGEGAGGST